MTDKSRKRKTPSPRTFGENFSEIYSDAAAIQKGHKGFFRRLTIFEELDNLYASILSLANQVSIVRDRVAKKRRK